MTTNDATPREALMNVLDVYLPDWVDEIGYQADAVIAHIWRMADDPAVMSQVADELNFYLLPDDGTSEKATQAAITTLLTTLLGPRPQESNDERTNT